MLFWVVDLTIAVVNARLVAPGTYLGSMYMLLRFVVLVALIANTSAARLKFISGEIWGGHNDTAFVLVAV